jgi:hypothetical protein
MAFRGAIEEHCAQLVEELLAAARPSIPEGV